MVKHTPAQHHTFECGCGTTRNSLDARLPVGWSTCRGDIWCNDCTAAGVPARAARAERKARRAA